MNSPKTPHLTQEELMLAATDVNRLSSEARGHLDGCQECRRNKDNLSKRFGNLAALSKRITSQSTPWFSLGTRGGGVTAPRPFGLKFMLIIALVVLLILLLNLYDPFHLNVQEKQAPSQPAVPMREPTSSLSGPLPEIYEGLTGMTGNSAPWWRQEKYIQGLKLTSDELDALDRALNEGLVQYRKSKQAVQNGQVDLAITLESEIRDQKAVELRYQRLVRAFAHLTEEQFKMLLTVRTILGPERFQTLLQLKRN